MGKVSIGLSSPAVRLGRQYFSFGAGGRTRLFVLTVADVQNRCSISFVLSARHGVVDLFDKLFSVHSEFEPHI